MNFSDIAFDRLMKSSPEIARYVTTFVDLTADLPETLGVQLGVFILGSPSGVSMYIPAIAKAGTLYPIDSVFNPAESMFFPLQENYILTSMFSPNTGSPVKMPSQVNQNPSVRMLVDPPRTGKHAYAGTLLAEAAYQLPNATKDKYLTKLASSPGLGKALMSQGIDLRSLLEALEKKAEATVTMTTLSEPGSNTLRVIKEGVGLPDDVIQSILTKGYGFIGTHDNPRLAINYDAVNDGYTQLTAAMPGSVYEVVMKDGSIKAGFVPKPLRSLDTLVSGDMNVTRPVFAGRVDANDTTNLSGKYVIFEDGTYMDYEANPVIKATSRSSSDEVVSFLANQGKILDLKEVQPNLAGDPVRGFIITDRGWIGPVTVYKKSVNETGITLHLAGCYGKIRHVHISPNLHGSISTIGNDIFVRDGAAFLLASMSEVEPETSVIAASAKRNLLIQANMQPMAIKKDGFDFYLNGSHIGSEYSIAKELAELHRLEKQVVLSLIKQASDTGYTTFWMSKSAAPSSIDATYQHGVTPPDQEDLMNRTQPEYNPNFQAIEGSTATNDRSIIEATIISEFVNDPDMFETLGSYLPVIREAIDKIGRSMFMLRLNINSVSNGVDPSYLSSTLIGLRNTYRNLGDSYMKLTQLASSSYENTNEVIPTGEVV